MNHKPLQKKVVDLSKVAAELFQRLTSEQLVELVNEILNNNKIIPSNIPKDDVHDIINILDAIRVNNDTEKERLPLILDAWANSNTINLTEFKNAMENIIDIPSTERINSVNIRPFVMNARQHLEERRGDIPSGRSMRWTNVLGKPGTPPS